MALSAAHTTLNANHRTYDLNFLICGPVTEAAVQRVDLHAVCLAEHVPLSYMYSLLLGDDGGNLGSLILAKEVRSVVHYGAVVVVKVFGGFAFTHRLEVCKLTFPHIFLHNLNILISIRPSMFVVESQTVHYLMHSPSGTTEALTASCSRLLQR